MSPVSANGLVFLRDQALVGYEDLSIHAVELGVKIGF